VGECELDLALDKDQWQALVNIIMNLQTPQNGGNFCGLATAGFSRIK
jgi:hypothetical protein